MFISSKFIRSKTLPSSNLPLLFFVSKEVPKQLPLKRLVMNYQMQTTEHTFTLDFSICITLQKHVYTWVQHSFCNPSRNSSSPQNPTHNIIYARSTGVPWKTPIPLNYTFISARKSRNTFVRVRVLYLINQSLFRYCGMEVH